VLQSGLLLFGHSTWELFARRWPGRTGPFADAMNRAAKVVVSHDRRALDAWAQLVAARGPTRRRRAIAGGRARRGGDRQHQNRSPARRGRRGRRVPLARHADRAQSGALLFSTTAELRLESVTAVDPAVLLRYRIV